MAINDELILRLLDIKFRDLMLSYSSMRVALEEVLEANPDLKDSVFHRIADQVIGIANLPEDKLLDVIDGSISEEEAHDRLDVCIDDMVAPAKMIFSRYLAADGQTELEEHIFNAVSDPLHDRLDASLLDESELAN